MGTKIFVVVVVTTLLPEASICDARANMSVVLPPPPTREITRVRAAIPKHSRSWLAITFNPPTKNLAVYQVRMHFNTESSPVNQIQGGQRLYRTLKVAASPETIIGPLQRWYLYSFRVYTPRLPMR